MDPKLSKAAAEGNIQPFQTIADHLPFILTPNKNTVLHIYITSQKKIIQTPEFVTKILDLCPSLLLQVNADDETLLHVAAKCGHSAIVKILTERAKAQQVDLESTVGVVRLRKMLMMTNKEGNTALHEAAARNKSIHVAEMLIKEDPLLSYSPNISGRTPLYIASENGNSKVAIEILEYCSSPSHEGPNRKTALHAAVLSNDGATVIKLLEKKRSLAKVKDQNGWIPLHYAAYYDCRNTIEPLLQTDVSVAYIRDDDRNMTGLHLATSQGNHVIMETIIRYCPDCIEMVDKMGWNALHFAMLSLHNIRMMIRRNPPLVSLLDKKDANGNTPLHVLAAFNRELLRRFVSWTKRALGCDLSIVNNQNISVEDVLRDGCSLPELKEQIAKLTKHDGKGTYPRGVIWHEDVDDDIPWQKAKESHLVVTTLITTVTFAAAFTLPGGYKSDVNEDHRGTAILSRESAFQAFVITDAIAMVLSLSSVFIHFFMSLFGYEVKEMKFMIGLLTLYAMGAMVLAFSTGLYVVLSPSSGLAITACVIGLSFIVCLVGWLAQKIWWPGARILLDNYLSWA